jgi:hypothetical protein
MQTGDDAMMVVRAELCERLAALRRSVERCRSADMDAQAESIRLIASAYGLTPVARLAEALKRAAGGPAARACPPALYLARLQDAIGCERRDEEASQAMLASVSVRLCA